MSCGSTIHKITWKPQSRITVLTLSSAKVHPVKSTEGDYVEIYLDEVDVEDIAHSREWTVNDTSQYKQTSIPNYDNMMRKN